MSLESELNKKINEYESYIDKINNIIDQDISGGLIAAQSHNSIQYYHSFINGDTLQRERKYISKDEAELIKVLANNSCYIPLLNLLSKRVKKMESLAKQYREDEIKDYINKLNPEVRSLSDTIYISLEEQIELWMSTPYHRLNFRNTDIKIYTKIGERVRSKSEKILADLFTDLGVKYKYECILTLSNGISLCPDFTFISPYTREEIFWEHFGMMDNPDYVINFIEKMEMYERNGIVQGKNLIVTFESSKRVLDVEYAQYLVRKYLLA